MIRKAASFEWSPVKKKGFQLVQTAVQDALPLGLHDQADPMVPEVSAADADVVWSLEQAPIGQSPTILCR